MSGSLLEVNIKVNSRDNLSVPDTSIIMEGEKSYVYKISNENIADKTEVKIGIRKKGNVEILSGLKILISFLQKLMLFNIVFKLIKTS